jgi:tRNA(Ile)-lysidine synthase
MKETASTTSLSKDNFLSKINNFPGSRKYWIAFSGGMDSSVLLHLFYLNKDEIKQDIEVLYVNHGLQKESSKWGDFCEEQCRLYGLTFTQLLIKEDCPKGVSVEAWAREKRYSIIEEVMNESDVLFTAHHQDDQVETFFMQALRGAGARGLASMPIVKLVNDVFHSRPLLNYSREILQRFAEENNLIWQDDESNMDCRYDRNYIRHKIIPVVEERWPSYRETISRLINHQQEYKVLLDDLASNDLDHTQHNESMVLDLEKIKCLSDERQKNLILYWLSKSKLDLPGSRNLAQIILDIICSPVDKSPCVTWKNTEVRRYKNLLYASKKTQEHDITVELTWKPEQALNVLNETLTAKPGNGKGISKLKTKDADFVIRYRRGGEKIHPNNMEHLKTVKQLFQEKSVIPWLRDRIPLVYINEKLAVIPGFCVDKSFSANLDEPSWDICWSGFDSVVQK